ncbi:prepilin peptidase [Candidatus Woesebacteria bacterium]|nr:prepilin peptidase [Candidatus Woesebacteria bacterium]
MEIIAALVGASFGSFLTALTYRLPKGLNIAKGRSICPHCKNQIAWYDNVPLLSFLILKGKCRSCGKKISLRYPLIEAATALLFVFYFLVLSGCPSSGTLGVLCSWQANFGVFSYLFAGVVISVLTAIFVIDLEKKIIPDGLIFIGILFVFVFYLLLAPDLVFKSFLTGFTLASFFLAIHLLTLGRGMGLGDVKFVVLGGMVLGWPQSAVWLFGSFVSGAVIGVILILLKKAKFGREIPFGPYLVASFFFTLIYGEKILNLYLK